MSYLPFAILAFFLNSIAVIIDKFLLTKTIMDPLLYIFYFSLISFLVLFAVPFVHFPALEVAILGSVATLTWTLGAYFMLTALKLGKVERIIPMIGTFTTIILLVFASQTNSIQNQQILAVVIMVLGLIFLTIGDWGGSFLKKELLLILGASFLFALSYYFLSQAFSKEGFLTVLVWSRLVLLPLGIILLSIPSLRKKIVPFITPKKSPFNTTALFFIIGQFSAGVSELLLVFAISQANPAIVNSIQGVKYVFLLIFSLILGRKFPQVFKRNLAGMFLISQIAGIGFIGIGIYLLAIS